MKLLARIREWFSNYKLSLGSMYVLLPRQVFKMVLLSGLELLCVIALGMFATITFQGEKTFFGITLGLYSSSAKWNFLAFCALLICLYAVRSYVGFRVFRSWAFFAERRKNQILGEMLSGYLSRPVSFHMQKNSADVFSRSMMVCLDYTTGVLGPSLRLINDGLIAIALVGFMLVTNFWAVMLLLGILFGIGTLAFDPIRRSIAHNLDTYSQLWQKIWKAFMQPLQSAKEVKLLGREDYFSDRLFEKIDPAARAYSTYAAMTTMPKLVIECAIVGFLVIYTWVVLEFIDASQLTTALGLLGVAALRLMPVSTSVMSSLASIRGHNNRLSLICEELRMAEAARAERRQLAAQLPAKTSFKVLCFQGVWFRYQESLPWVLKELDFVVKSGDSLGIMGRSGAGKSTFADLLLGLIQPNQGTVKLDGIDISNNPRLWQDLVAYIPQTVNILDDTLRRNIAMGIPDADIDDTRIWQALTRSQLMSWVSEKAQGLDTLLGERGVLLSGGQRQRIAIARALYDQREVFVMDEATSALDEETERAVIESMSALKGQKTLIVIAHKASILKHLDSIYSVEDGGIRLGLPNYTSAEDEEAPASALTSSHA
jgi:ATP-binding cassette, subfamily B, bacterial PglK